MPQIGEVLKDATGLVPGDWVEMQYGWDRHMFYVQENTARFCRLSMPTWCASSHDNMPPESFTRPWHAPVVYLGRTKKRWWWRWLVFRDIVCPYPKPPKRDGKKE